MLSIAFFVGIFFNFAEAEVPPVVQGLHDPPIGCHMRLYTYRITQSDSKGSRYLVVEIKNSMN